MSPAYNSTSDDLGLNGNRDPSLLSPYNYPPTISNSASPSYIPNSTTPGGSSEYSTYQQSELSEIDDEFLGVDFNAGVNRFDSFPSNFDNTYFPDTHPLPVLHPQAPENHAGSLTATTYPLSPKLTSIPNTPSPRVESHELKAKATISQYEFTNGLHNSQFQPFTVQTTIHPSTVQLTPDQSGSSHTSAEGVAPSAMGHPDRSPQVTVSQWGPQEAQNPKTSRQAEVQSGGTVNAETPDTRYASQTLGQRDDDGVWRPNLTTGQAGIDPEARKAIADIEVPKLREQEEQRRIESKNIEVQEWRSQAGESSEDEATNQSYFTFNSANWQQQPGSREFPIEENDIAPVDDAESIHENRLIEGQVYYQHPKNGVLTDHDVRLMSQPRHWSDAPMMPLISTTNFQQPETANDAIKRWNDNADAMSLTSRVATWGTRRRSETNLADMEAVADGSFLKRLSISKNKDRDGNRIRQNSIFDQGLDKIANIVRNRSDSKLKRGRSSQDMTAEASDTNNHRNSQGSLALPRNSSSYMRRSTPNVNTALAAMGGHVAAVGATHARNGSVSVAAPSPRSPTTTSGATLGFARSVIQRHRSRSELSTHDKIPQPGIVGLWKSQGGPPVANLASPPVDSEAKQQPQELQDQEDDDDEDDEQADENDLRVNAEHEAEPIITNYEGFKAHVRRLNPDMDPRHKWLVSRIAHQQEIRYKNLLDLRVKHLQATSTRSCGAGRLCVALGGAATLLDAHGKPREQDRGASGLHLVTDFSDHDSNPGEGALTDETFPLGVPMPPSRNLPAEFECQLCFKVKKFQKPSDWTKHVHEDVQPFTCTYDKCKEPKSFKRKADWVRHENERHRHLEWWICQVDDCRHPCYRKDNFLQHLVREHKLPEPKQKTKAAIKKARLTEPAWIMLEKCHHETQNKPQDEPCKFCGKNFNTWKKLTVHLAKHMEYISLPVLRLVEARHVDANTIISPVEQILTPITPTTRQQHHMDLNSSFNMANIPPHIPMGQQFTSGFDQPSYYPTSGQVTPYGQAAQSQNLGYGHNPVYPNAFSDQQMSQPRAFSSIHNAPNNMHTTYPAQEFAQLGTNYPQPKIEQPHGFDTMGSGFNPNIPNQSYSTHQAFPMQNDYVSNPPAVSGYQAPNMLGISDPVGYGFDHMALEPGNNFQQQVPMTRGPGSASSYGHSPQNAPTSGSFYAHH